MMTLAQLRSLAPKRPLTPSEAKRIAELQANRLLASIELSGPPVPKDVVGGLARVRVEGLPEIPVSGSSHWTGRDWVVVVSTSEPRVRQRFTAAHELKHVLDHGRAELLYGHLKPSNGRDFAEVIADSFAAYLLLPKRLVIRAFTTTSPNIADLAVLFDVSRTAMYLRLVELGLTPRVSEVAA